MTIRVAIGFAGVCVCGAVLSGCAAKGRESGPTVRQFGAMRAVMREGETEARVRLAECVAERHVYAVGALAGLEGEVTIVDGEAWVSRVEGSGIRCTGPGVGEGDAATLLTLATVGDWDSVELPRGAGDIADLEGVVEAEAARRGIDSAKPFPFVVEGEASSLELHVIRGFCPANDAGATDSEAWRLSLDGPTRALLVGFFARDSEGVMTHHGTALHVHALLSHKGQRIAGHVDGVGVNRGAVLRLPRR